ncbi:MAG TPA: hypothetical protein VML75_12685 [Kofleriaceae bacterium]|nr:hypothetical protein [Kofleriaceae bacterium]
MTPGRRFRWAWPAALVLAVGLLVAACPGGGGAPAVPTEVELDWPDAGAIRPAPVPAG